jgi:hypothetical protein
MNFDRLAFLHVQVCKVCLGVGEGQDEGRFRSESLLPEIANGTQQESDCRSFHVSFLAICKQ